MQEDKKFRSGFVAIIGRPNVGKSTLMNCIIGQKIAIMSSKAQTTRKRIETVYTNEEGQIVFLDTPGMNRSRNKLGDFMVNEVSSAFSDADVVMFPLLSTAILYLVPLGLFKTMLLRFIFDCIADRFDQHALPIPGLLTILSRIFRKDMPDIIRISIAEAGL